MKSVAKRSLGVVCFVAIAALGVGVTMLLWNALIPTIFGWSAVPYWQAAGLLLLSRLLFGGFRGFGLGGRCGWMMHRRHRGHCNDRKDLHEKFAQMKNMSREEKREFFRSRMQEGDSHFDGCFFDKRNNVDETKPE